MADGLRSVHRLQLRAADAEGIRRGALLLEDALRTASLPDMGGRILAVRRLALGSIRASASPQTLALTVERQFARLNAQTMHAADAGAGAAPIVWFRDALEVHTLAALRLASDKTADEWYWPLVIRTWNPQPAPGPALRALALSVAALPEAPVALPAWTAALAHAGHGSRLIECLGNADLPPLAAAAGLKPPQGGTARSQRVQAGWTKMALLRALVRAAGPVADEIPGAIDSSVPIAGSPDVRSRRADSADNARRADEHGLMGSARHTGVRDHRHQTARHHVGGIGIPAVRSALPASATGSPKVSHQGLPAIAAAGSRDASAAGSGATPSRDALADRRASPAEAHALAVLEAVAEFHGEFETAAGGLSFLLPVLARLGYAQWLDAQPNWRPWEVARRVMAQTLARLAVPSDDPAWMLAATRSPRTVPPRRFIAPESWSAGLQRGSGSPWLAARGSASCLYDPSARLLLAAWRGPRPRSLLGLLKTARALPPDANDPDLVDLVAVAWLTACRRWLRRHAGIGLADLVLRPASLGTTPTHVNLFFHLDQADVRLRRAGLDLDPGWLPWLKRVVGFHYRSGNGS